ncbi:MAG: hypothetical protein M1829_000236 [Trizodia sp. TS-e1964]|nr:MAG: hypothetical protein M1829_000236 [Trizodia sp. TS-e1964]
MDMEGHAMVFDSTTTTPLYSLSWTPTSTAAYAGTCVFLALLAVSFRCLITLSALLSRRALDAALNRRYITVAGSSPREKSQPHAEGEDAALLTHRGVDEEVRVVRARKPPVLPWRWSTDVPRALLVAAIATVGYFLMLGVMTYNVGYFVSVVVGIFVGDLAVGRFGVSYEH